MPGVGARCGAGRNQRVPVSRAAPIGRPRVRYIDMAYVIGLQCHLCKAMFPAQALWVCDKCLGPLEVIYDYDKVRRDMTREKIASRANNLWRYRELLPIEGEPRTGLYSG